MIKFLAIAGLTLGMVQWLSWEAPKEFYVLEVVTLDGNVFEIGSGSNCTAAWERAVWPNEDGGDWSRISCVKTR